MKKGLKAHLDELYAQYHSKAFLYSDPLEIVHRYSTPSDQEAVGLLAALLAYGNVKQIKRSVETALQRMEGGFGTPTAYVRALSAPSTEKKARLCLKGWVHRLNQGSDLALLLWLLSQSWNRYSTLGAHFTGYLPKDSPDFTPALDRLIADWKAWAKISSWPRGPGFLHLLNAPSSGSVCKRWSMYLRWMGRSDDLDLGLWAVYGLRPDQLIIPLDTHTGRISKELGLTQRKSLNWKAAQEVTAALRGFDPVDPVRYDFALCRVGMLDKLKQERGPKS